MTLLDLQPRPSAPLVVTVDGQPQPADPADDTYPARKVLLGSVGRVWLWFLVGCVAVTLLPLIIGWSSYLIETGSMKPSIKPGDVVITSPNPELADLGGRVITFDSPSIPGQIVTHRVVEIDSSGVMRTKGDANVQPDTATITIDDVRGMGRLLVRYVGLPKLWAQNGDWIPLSAFLLSLVIAGLAVRYDREDDGDSTEPTAFVDGPSEPIDGVGPLALSASGFTGPTPGGGPGHVGSGTTALGVPRGVADLRALLNGDEPLAVPRPRAPRLSSAVVFVLLATLYGAALAVPSAMAAVSARTQANASAWTSALVDYSTELLATSPWVYYRLDDTNNGNQAVDASGFNRDGRYDGTVAKNQVGALTTDTPNRAVALNSADACVTMANSAKVTPAPTVYSVAGWFKVPNGYTSGGKIAGFESTRTGVSSSASGGGQYDRHVYLDGSGRVRFGVWLGYSFSLKSQAGLNDGNWHFFAATLGPAGMRLYVNGVLVDQSTNTASEVFSNGGWWRFGCGNLSGWSSSSGANEAWSGPNAPVAQQNYPLRGTLDELAIWQNRVLTAQEIALLYYAR